MAKVLQRSLYQTDYYAWTRDQAAKLRAMAAARGSSTLDLENLAEEVESLGRRNLNTVWRVIEHLLELEFSLLTIPAPTGATRWPRPGTRSRTTSRPACVATDLGRLFRTRRRAAALGLRRHGAHEAEKALPTACPYSLDQIVRGDWYPNDRHGIVDDLEDV